MLRFCRSPGYLNLMTTQECLATLLVRVSYPGDLFQILSETGTRFLQQSCRENQTVVSSNYEKPDAVNRSTMEGMLRV